MSQPEGISRLWHRDLFSGSLSKFWVERFFSETSKSSTEKEIAFLREVMRRGVVLDLCCGPGRHSIPLSSYGRVVSLDLSKQLLSALKKRSRNKSSYKNLNLVQGDIKKLPFKSGFFDDVINLETSFGYFTDKENELVLQEVSRVLKPNGIFVLDIANPGWIIANFQARDWDETDGFYVLQERSIDWQRKRVTSRWILIDKTDKEITEVPVDHRLYDLNELRELLTKAGFEITNAFGSPEKEEFHSAKSRRIYLVSRKQV